MRKGKPSVECPECRGQLKVWVDVDASVSFSVSRTGRLTHREIQNNHQGDGRCGLKCQQCTWSIYGSDAPAGPLSEALDTAAELVTELQLSAKKAN